MYHVPLPVLSAYKICMSAFLQFLWIIHIRGKYRIAWIFLVWSPDGTGSRHSYHMLISGSTFCHQQIIIFSNMVNMWTFCIATSGSREDIFRLSHQAFLLRIILLYQNSLEIVDHIHNIHFAICIMKYRWVKARAVQINWLRPAATDVLRFHKVIMGVKKSSGTGFHVRINQPEVFPVPGNIRCPYATGIILTNHIKLAHSVQRRWQLFIMLQIFRMIDFHTRPPFKA